MQEFRSFNPLTARLYQSQYPIGFSYTQKVRFQWILCHTQRDVVNFANVCILYMLKIRWVHHKDAVNDNTAIWIIFSKIRFVIIFHCYFFLILGKPEIIHKNRDVSWFVNENKVWEFQRLGQVICFCSILINFR